MRRLGRCAAGRWVAGTVADGAMETLVGQVFGGGVGGATPSRQHGADCVAELNGLGDINLTRT